MSALLQTSGSESSSGESDCAVALRHQISLLIDGHIVDVDREGRPVAVANRDLLQRAEALACELSRCKHGSDVVPNVVLCVEDAASFVPAFWASVFSGINVLTVSYTPNDPRSFARRLLRSAHAFSSPILMTSSAIAGALEDEVYTSFRAVIRFEDVSLGQVPAASASAAGGSLFIGTSGSTAQPKLVRIPWPAYLARMRGLARVQVVPSSLTFLPLDTLAGPAFAWPHAETACFLKPDQFAADPLSALALVETYRIGRLITTSGLAGRLLGALERSTRRFDLACLKLLGFGSEMIVPEVVGRLSQALQEHAAPPLTIAAGYGMTETGLLCRTEWRDVASFHQQARRGVPAVGQCLPHCAIRVVDERGRLLPSPQVGALEVSVPAKMFAEYHGDAAATAEAFSDDGWFRTGDLGFIKDGEVTITGRAKSVIVVNGKNTSLEQIEGRLKTIPGLDEMLVAGAAVRSTGATTDELALFFVPVARDEQTLQTLCGQFTRITAETFGISVSHFIPLTLAEFPRSSGGKILRAELMARYYAGQVQKFELFAPAIEAGTHDVFTGTQRALLECWTKTLKLTHSPGLDDNFYELGGTSLASAELIMAVEDRFGRNLPIEAFFTTPTLRGMAEVVDCVQAKAAVGQADPLRSIEAYTVSWPGEPIGSHSLVHLLNAAGTKPPLLWVFQSASEFEQLSGVLGPDQPIYGMRSLANILKIREHTKDVLDDLANTYATEVLSRLHREPFFIGGNCQGGIIALALARHLNSLGHSPLKLILMEWNFHFGRYPQPVAILYGRQSHTARLYSEDRDRRDGDPDWERDFPDHRVMSIPGAHGQFFDLRNIKGLARAIQDLQASSLPVRKLMSAYGSDSAFAPPDP